MIRMPASYQRIADRFRLVGRDATNDRDQSGIPRSRGWNSSADVHSHALRNPPDSGKEGRLAVDLDRLRVPPPRSAAA